MCCIIMEFMNTSLPTYQLSPALSAAIEQQVVFALAEDVGAGDLTASLVPAAQISKATIVCREPAVICGIPWVNAIFQRIAPASHIEWLVIEGEEVMAGQALCNINGKARELLTAERCALNFLQTLSATASETRRYAKEIAGTQAQVMDTRKTIPGMRLAQKYAVLVGGGANQRIGLYDGILIKENHIAAAGGIDQVLSAAKALQANVSIQIEVESINELEIALEAGAQLILLDNFDFADLRKAVFINQGRAILEASGGITIENIREIALTGVQRISVGSLTKNIHAIDLSMRFHE